jgi:hypothetical protein
VHILHCKKPLNAVVKWLSHYLPVSYSGSSGFSSRTGNRATLTEDFHGLSQSFQTNAETFRSLITPYSHGWSPDKTSCHCRGRVVSTPSYSGGPGFKSRPRDRLSRQVFVVLLSAPGKCWDNTLNYAITASFHILSNSLIIYLPVIDTSLCYRQRR